MRKILSIVGARPNFMKVAPIYRALKQYRESIDHRICHTGQHYDKKMSKVFFEDLELPVPDFNLGVGGGTHAEQTARIMIEFEKVINAEKPDLIVVVGDVNSTLACSLVASKLGVRIAHVEAGLRSFDRRMPEEINRILTDSISDLLFVSERSGLVNLKREGIDETKTHYVGNVMIDSLVHFLPKAERRDALSTHCLKPKEYALVTLHRPSNVDNSAGLSSIIAFLNRLAERSSILFPLHPRTRKNISSFQLEEGLHKNIILTEPFGYLDFLSILKNASLVLTDSGGIQEETTFLGVPCITMRDTTERPVTIEVGTNQLVGADLNLAYEKAISALFGRQKEGRVPDLWDGKAAERISNILCNCLDSTIVPRFRSSVIQQHH